MIPRKTWLEMRTLAVIYAALLILEHVIAIIQWPELRSPTLMGMIPADFIQRWVAGMVSYQGYMALEVFFKGVNVVGIAAAVLLGTGLIARERENQSLEFLLSRPLSRARLLWGKFWVAALVLTVPIVLTSWAVIPLGHWLVDEELAFGLVTEAALYSAAFCLMFLSLTALCSVVFRTQVHAAFAIGTIVVFQLSIYFIQGIRAVSVFRLSDYDVYGPILAGHLPAHQLLFGRAIWILLATAVFYAVAARTFTRQEL